MQFPAPSQRDPMTWSKALQQIIGQKTTRTTDYQVSTQSRNIIGK